MRFHNIEPSFVVPGALVSSSFSRATLAKTADVTLRQPHKPKSQLTNYNFKDPTHNVTNLDTIAAYGCQIWNTIGSTCYYHTSLDIRVAAAVVTTSATMASPASSTGDEQKKNMEQITFRFCSEWYYLNLCIS
jgi:hypothetical protein